MKSAYVEPSSWQTPSTHHRSAPLPLLFLGLGRKDAPLESYFDDRDVSTTKQGDRSSASCASAVGLQFREIVWGCGMAQRNCSAAQVSRTAHPSAHTIETVAIELPTMSRSSAVISATEAFAATRHASLSLLASSLYTGHTPLPIMKMTNLWFLAVVMEIA